MLLFDVFLSQEKTNIIHRIRVNLIYIQVWINYWYFFEGFDRWPEGRAVDTADPIGFNQQGKSEENRSFVAADTIINYTGVWWRDSPSEKRSWDCPEGIDIMFEILSMKYLVKRNAIQYLIMHNTWFYSG